MKDNIYHLKTCKHTCTDLMGGGGGRGQVVQTSRLKIFNLPIIDLRTPHP